MKTATKQPTPLRVAEVESVNWTQLDFPERKHLMRQQIEEAGRQLMDYWFKFIIGYTSGVHTISWSQQNMKVQKKSYSNAKDIVFTTNFHSSRHGDFRAEVHLSLEDVEDLSKLTNLSPPERVWAHVFFERPSDAWWRPRKWELMKQGGKDFSLHVSVPCPYQLGETGTRDILATMPVFKEHVRDPDHEKAKAGLSCFLMK